MTLHVDRAATAQALEFDTLIPALERLFVAGCEVPARQVLAVGDALTALVMPAWIPGRYFGLKVVNVAPGNAARGLPGLFASYQLFDAATGAPLALIDGGELTARRTAAASALAASRLAARGAGRHLIVGAGRVGSLLAPAFATACRIQAFAVWSRDAASAARLAASLRQDGFDAQAVDDLESAARQADIVSCATLAGEPLIRGDWLRPGTHLDLIGGFTPAMREADDACIAGAQVWVDTEEALAKAGDLVQPLASGALRREDVRGTLAQLCAARTLPRDPAARTVFKSVGTALADLAAAILVYESLRVS